MARYDAQTLIRSVEKHLNGEVPEAITQETSPSPTGSEMPATYEVFQNDVLPRLGVHNAVNKQSPEAKPSVLKKIYLKLFSPFLNRQAVFNAETMRGFDLASNHIDQMQKRIIDLQKQQETLVDHVTNLEARLSSEQNSRFESIEETISGLQNVWEAMLGEQEAALEASLGNVEQKITTLENDVLGRVSKIDEIHKDLPRLESDLGSFGKNIESISSGLQEFKDEAAATQNQNNFYFQNLNNQFEKVEDTISFGDGELAKRIEAVENHVAKPINEKLNDKDQSIESRIKTISQEFGLYAKKDDLSWIGNSYNVMEQRIGSVEAEYRRLESKQIELSEFRALLNETIRSIEDQAKTLSSSKDMVSSESAAINPQELSNPIAELKSKDRDLNYHRFQKEFRGDGKILRSRQSSYIEVFKRYFSEDQTIVSLDVACGDGVFVGLQKEAGWESHGVDSNHYMVEEAKERDLSVVKDDAFKYLEECESETYNIVSALQFVEHLRPDDLEKFLSEVYRVLSPNGILLIETLNPHTMLAHKWFHFDLTHQKLIFPEMLELLAKTNGYEIVERRTINPVEEHQKLAFRHNESNWQRLNDFLYGDQDYYLIIRKRDSS